jgi:hypothetical protein
MHNMPSNKDLRYPVGKFQATENPDTDTINSWIRLIADFPAQVRAEVSQLDEKQLNWQYRPEGWSIRQVLHHCADSHINAMCRFKFALTEDGPTIKPYNETAWAELPDVVHTPIAASLSLLEGLHARWATLLLHLSAADYERYFIHPEHGKVFSIVLGIDHYQWHCRHHLGHIRQAKRMNE